MHRKILTIALAVLAFALAASPALGASRTILHARHTSHHHAKMHRRGGKSPHRYSPRHGAKCRKAYRRTVKHWQRHGRRHRKVYCVKRATKKRRRAKAITPAATPAPPASNAPSRPAAREKTRLHAHLDPTYVRNPLNPFEVTYSFSASATKETVGSGIQETAALPSGVLSLFSDGKLECAVNVGSGVEGSECPVTYQVLGTHSVTTIYSSGEQSSTETEIENIEPLATSTTMTAVYEPFEHAVLTPKGEQTGVLNLTVEVTPSTAWDEGSLPFAPECPLALEPACINLPFFEFALPAQLFHEGSATASVYMQGSEVKIGAIPPPSSGGVKWWPLSEIEDGSHYLLYRPAMHAGFTQSFGKVTLRFTPEIIP